LLILELYRLILSNIGLSRSSGGSSLGTMELHSGVVNALTGAVERFTRKHYILSLEP
jgi:hypothetical protein